MAKRHSRRGFIKGAGMVAGALVTPATSALHAQTGSRPANMSMGARLRELLARPEPLLSPSAHDVMSGRLIELEGFQSITVGGSAASASRYGIPDFGLITITELIDFAGNIAENVNIPVMADGDDGGGSPINVYRATQNFEKRGIAAVMYEDTVQVKHLSRSGGELVSKAQMVDKIKAAVDARRDPGFVIIARNDSLGEGYPMAEAHERGVAYAEAGADVIFFSGMSLEETAKARDLVKKPLMSTVNATTVNPAKLREARISFAVYTQLFGISLGAARQALQELKTTGLLVNSSKLSLPGDVNARLIGSQETIARGRKYNLVK